MKNLLLLFSFLLLGTFAKGQEQRTGIFKTYEDYQNRKYSNHDVFLKNGAHTNDVFFQHVDGEKYKLDLETTWGYKDSVKASVTQYLKGRYNRIAYIDSVSKKKRIFSILKDGPISVFGINRSGSATLNDEGDIESLGVSFLTDIFIAKTVNGTLMPFNEQNVKKLIADQPKLLQAYENGELKAKRSSKDDQLLTAINIYNRISTPAKK